MNLILAEAHLKGPHIEFGGLSPLIALLGGAVIVLLFGLIGSRWVRSQLVPALTLLAPWRGTGPDDLAVGLVQVDRLGGPEDRHPLAAAEPDPDRRRRLHGAVGLALAGGPRSRPWRVPRPPSDLDRRHVAAGGRTEHRRPVHRPGAPVDPPLCALRDRDAPRALARVGAEVPDRRLGRLGHAALRPGHDLRRDRHDRLHGHRTCALLQRPGQRPADAHGDRPLRRGAGLQGLCGSLPPVDAGRLRGRPHARHGLHGRHHQGRGPGGLPALLRRRPDRSPGQLGPGRRGTCGDHDHRRQRRAPWGSPR